MFPLYRTRAAISSGYFLVVYGQYFMDFAIPFVDVYIQPLALTALV
jgi:hypothetical protein